MESAQSLFYRYRRLLAFSLAMNATFAVLLVVLGGVGAYAWITAHPGFFLPGGLVSQGAAAVGRAPQNQNQVALSVPAIAAEQTVVGIVKKTSGAVFAIQVSQRLSPDDYWPLRFFRADRERMASESEMVDVGEGTGFFISSDGYLVTNKHVVSLEGVSLGALLDDGRRLPISIVYTDPESDIAIGKVETARELPYLELGDSSSIQVGQSVIVIGNALAQYANSVSTGIISGLSRSIIAGDALGTVEAFDELIQIDASVYPGNSGGPLLDLFGRVIGVTLARAAGSEHIGFALPVNLVKKSIEQAGIVVHK